MKSVIEYIQDDDPSYDPLTQVLAKAQIDRSKWIAACDRVYMDGYYGPLNDEEWREQDGREPSTVKDAIKLIARVLSNVEDVWRIEYCDDIRNQPDTEDYAFCEPPNSCKGHRIDMEVPATEIKAALVPWYHEIYGVGYPSV